MKILTDLEIGNIIRHYRRLKGLSQTEVANFLKITFQQVQKYETGANRVSISTYINLCNFMGMPFNAILEDAEAIFMLPKMKNQELRQLKEFKLLSPSLRQNLLELVEELRKNIVN
jgi:transcriptional regulator with XRE-family HTH domain